MTEHITLQITQTDTPNLNQTFVRIPIFAML